MTTPTSSSSVYQMDVRAIDRRFRHPAVAGALDTLQHGEVMRFVNDHDPVPLLQQLAIRYGDALSAEYVSREPDRVVVDFRRV
jgi:uncharacterized protein (DUF2249 family)